MLPLPLSIARSDFQLFHHLDADLSIAIPIVLEVKNHVNRSLSFLVERVQLINVVVALILRDEQLRHLPAVNFATMSDAFKFVLQHTNFCHEFQDLRVGAADTLLADRFVKLRPVVICRSCEKGLF